MPIKKYQDSLMPNNWKTYKLDEVLEIKNGKSKPKEIGKIPIYGGNGILGYTSKVNNDSQVIIIGRVGAYCGSVYYEDKPVWISDNAMSAKVKDNGCNQFFYYLLKKMDLNSFAGGSSQPLLTQSTLNSIKVRIPPLPEQKAIAGILSAIDDKIENNLAINKTLEEMAMALYKHWFVDFGPFQNGEFVESELGPIPKGWEVKRFSDFTETTDYVANGSFKSLKDNVQTYDHEEYALYIRLVDYNNGFVGNLKYVDKTSFDFLKKSKIKGKEVIISNVGANAGTVFRPPVWLNQPMTLGSNSIMILENEFNEILYRYFLSHEGQHSLKNIMSGSAQPKFNKTDFRNMKFAFPNIEIVKGLNDKLRSIQEIIILNNSQKLTLTKLRDTLLPKLISGEVRLKKFKEEIEKVL